MQELITRDYLLELDKEIELIPLTFDPIFKGVFGNNLKLLKRFIIKELKLDLKEEECNIILKNPEFPKENYKEYQMTIDLYIVINNKIIADIEINKRDFNSVKRRNISYLAKQYSMIYESGEEIDNIDNKQFYQLNINTMNKNNKYGEEIIKFYNTTTKEVFLDDPVIILKYLEYYRKKYYNGDVTLKEEDLWLVALTSKNFTELYDITSKFLPPKLMDIFIKEAIRMSTSDFSIHAWQKETMDALVALDEKRYYEGEIQKLKDKAQKIKNKTQKLKDENQKLKEEGQKLKEEGQKLKEEGKKLKEEGQKLKEEGQKLKEDSIKSNIINMLKENIDIEVISRVTGKGVEEIKEIANLK